MWDPIRAAPAGGGVDYTAHWQSDTRPDPAAPPQRAQRPRRRPALPSAAAAAAAHMLLRAS
eukprot:SAG31_NODE_13692_length_852_cov_9.422311_2_plen_60_part_01